MSTDPVVGAGVLLRADAGPRLGSGHVARLRSLTEALVDRGAQVSLVGEGVPPSDELWTTWSIAPPAAGPASADGELVPLEQRIDAARTLESFGDPGPVLVVVDSYRLGRVWEQEIRRRAPAVQIVAIDDLPERVHDADLLVDPNLGDVGPVNAIAAGRRTLRGTAYAPLAGAYALPLRPADTTDGRPHLVVSLGGGRQTLVPHLARLLVTARDLAEVAITFVVPDSDDHAAVRLVAQGREDVAVNSRLPSLRPLLERATLVIGAGGTSSWERLRLGVPSVVVALADNQRRTCEELRDRGLSTWVEHPSEPEMIVDAVVRALSDGDSCARARRIGPLLVDGLGARRIVLAAFPSVASPVLRGVVAEDAAALFAIANDPDTRSVSRVAARIAPDEHLAWFARVRARDGTTFWMVEVDGLAVGQIRFHRSHSCWEVSYALEAAARGKGWATDVVRAGVRRLRAVDGGPIVAVVHAGNLASHRVFRRLGFEHDADGVAARRLGVALGSGFSAYLLPQGCPTR
jgi:UDP-2,4-diacetamido-2,4,6-trideoxy-beta-L-altropyranose hydrolase